MSNCQSCGMPMEKPEDYGGGQVGNLYCKHCTDDQGNLLPKEEVRKKMIQFQMQSLNKTEEQAEADVDKHMALMPAWKLGEPAITPPLSVSELGVPSPGTKPTPKPTPSDIGAPKLTGLGVSSPPAGPIPDEPPAEPETPPLEPTFEPPVSRSKLEPFKPEESPSGPSVDPIKEKPLAKPGELGEEVPEETPLD